MGFLHHKQKLIHKCSQTYEQMYMINYTTSRKEIGENLPACELGKYLLDMTLYLRGWSMKE